MQKLITFLLFLALCNIVSAQNSYYVTDSAYVSGIKIQDRTAKENSQSFIVQFRNNFEEFFPQQVKEYNIDGKKIYYSKKIKIGNTSKQVFLQALHIDSLKQTLFLYAEKGFYTYFTEDKEGNLIHLKKHDENGKNTFKKQLKMITNDCAEIQEAIPFVKYSQGAMLNFYNRYSNRNFRPLPRLKFGITGGYQISNISADKSILEYSLKDLAFPTKSNLFLGAFIDHPIQNLNLSAHIELNYTRFSYYDFYYTYYYNIDFSLKYSTISLPVLVRYTLPNYKFRPFANAGFLFNYNEISEQNMVMTTITRNAETYGDSYTITTHESPLTLPQTQMGYVIGAGIEYKVTPRNFITFEVRFSQTPSLNKFSMGNSNTQFLTSINF